MRSTLRPILVCALLFCIAGAFAQTADRVETLRRAFADSVPAPLAYINDYENLLSLSEEMALETLIDSIEQTSGVEIAVLTIDSLFVADAVFDTLMLYIARTWGVGKAGLDNGIFIGISSGHRRVRINTGRGIEQQLTDAEVEAVINMIMIPYFRSSDWYKGQRLGIAALMRELE